MPPEQNAASVEVSRNFAVWFTGLRRISMNKETLVLLRLIADEVPCLNPTPELHG